MPRPTNGERLWRLARDVVLFVAGLAGVVHETLEQVPDPTLLAVFVAMMGLPVVLRKDEK